MTTWIQTSNTHQDGTPVTRRIKLESYDSEVWFTTNAYSEVADDVADILASTISHISKLSSAPAEPGGYYGDAGEHEVIQINVADGTFDNVVAQSIDIDSWTGDSINVSELSTTTVDTESSTNTGVSTGATTQQAPAVQDRRSLPWFPTNWSKAGTDPIININDVVGHPSLFHAGRFLDNPIDEWYMYASSHDPYGITLITAPSLDQGATWTEQNVLFDAGTFAATEGHVAAPSSIWNPDTEEVYLYYHTIGNNNSSDQHQYQRLAKAADGETFTDEGQVNDPLRLGLWDDKERTYLSVMKYNNMYVGVYQGRGESATPIGIGFCYSQTGEAGTWRRKEEPLFSNRHIEPIYDIDSSAQQVATPHLTEFGGQIWLLSTISSDGNDHAIYATPISDEGQVAGTPQLVLEATLSWEGTGIAWPRTYVEGDTMHLFYHSTGSTTRRIGHATADLTGVFA